MNQPQGKVWVRFVGTTGFGANDTMGFARLARVGTFAATRFFADRTPLLVSKECLPELLDVFRGRLAVKEVAS